jgi:hypothetical protein
VEVDNLAAAKIGCDSYLRRTSTALRAGFLLCRCNHRFAARGSFLSEFNRAALDGFSPFRDAQVADSGMKLIRTFANEQSSLMRASNTCNVDHQGEEPVVRSIPKLL